MLVLDREPESSRYGFVSGYATNNDSEHLVAPDSTGHGAEACMRAAIQDAGIAPDGIGHINAHGTGTILNDRSEARAIERVFSLETPVIAPKATIGHLIGGAGVIEAIISLQALHHQTLPPTPNWIPDPDLPALRITNQSAQATQLHALTNSFAFGGTNASLILSSTLHR